MSRAPRLPDVHIVKLEGDYAEAVTSPICDFCGDVGPTWDYGCADFHIDSIPSPFDPEAAWGSTGDWAVCDECAHFIEQDVPGMLCARMISQSGMETPWLYVAKIVNGFWDHKTGERAPFG